MKRDSAQNLLNLSELPSIDASKFYSHSAQHVSATVNSSNISNGHPSSNSHQPAHLSYITALRKVQEQHLLVKEEIPELYRFFTRQDAAFHAFDDLPPHVQCQSKVYSYETEELGKRHFLLSDNQVFFDKYLQIPLQHRHLYEIIRHTFPCRLYFDLEYHRPSNPHANGYDLTAQWITLVIWKLQELYHITVDKKYILVLDSSTEEKFSKHVIFNLSATDTGQEYLFCDNQEMSLLVRAILLDITHPVEMNGEQHYDQKYEMKQPAPDGVEDVNNKDTVDHDHMKDGYVENRFQDKPNHPQKQINLHHQDLLSLCQGYLCSIDGQWRTPYSEYRPLWLRTSDSNQHSNNSNNNNNYEKRQLFVDTGVYTKNRAFRLYGSCKHGKVKVLGIDPYDEKQYYSFQLQHKLPVQQFAAAKRKEIMLRAYIVPLDVLVCNTVKEEEKMKENRIESTNDVDGCHNSNQTAQSSSSSISSDYRNFESYQHLFNRSRYALLPRLGSIAPLTANSNPVATDVHHCRKRNFQTMSASPETQNRFHHRMDSLLLLPTHHLQAHHTERKFFMAPLTNMTSTSTVPFPSTSTTSATSWKQQIILQSTYPRQATPFANITQFDSFINWYFAQTKGAYPSGHIASWIISASYNVNRVLVYKMKLNIAGSKYCPVIQRPHKSNGVFLECELMTGRVMYKCWDHECQQVRKLAQQQHQQDAAALHVFVLPKGLLPESPEEIIRIVNEAVNK